MLTQTLGHLSFFSSCCLIFFSLVGERELFSPHEGRFWMTGQLEDSLEKQLLLARCQKMKEGKKGKSQRIIFFRRLCSLQFIRNVHTDRRFSGLSSWYWRELFCSLTSIREIKTRAKQFFLFLSNANCIIFLVSAFTLCLLFQSHCFSLTPTKNSESQSPFRVRRKEGTDSP
jgi:hypothetical protein